MAESRERLRRNTDDVFVSRDVRDALTPRILAKITVKRGPAEVTTAGWLLLRKLPLAQFSGAEWTESRIRYS
jgi:hypothetical protein